MFIEIICPSLLCAITLLLNFKTFVMKTRIIVITGILAIAISGCLVKSLHPFYKESDVEFNIKLLGNWLDEDSATWRINPFVFSKGLMKGDTTDNSYLVEMFDDSTNVSKFNVHLFRLDGKQYLDFTPLREGRYEEMIDIHLIPAHSIAKIDFISDSEVAISWFDEEWLENLFEENRVKISHEVINTPDNNYKEEYVLTASTEELQKFIIKYGSEEDAYLCDNKNKNFMCTRLKKNK
jgi:hypothetical protein